MAVSNKRILLTGAAGGIGSAFFRSASSAYFFRLADRQTETLTAASLQGHEIYPLDVSDLEACQQACQGIDTVIHLAANASPDADFYGSLLQDNIQGSYNIFRAAKDQGCQRVIFASSAQVFMGYPPDVQAHSHSPWRPANMYGVSKCFGEAVAAYFAWTEGLSSIVLRIGAYDKAADPSNPIRRDPNTLNLSGYVSERDLNQLLRKAVDVEDVQFALIHGISNNRFKRLDLTATQQILGYAPQDDAFEIFHDDLTAWLQN
ncbi:MAG TPA: NAD(P)-dependent oxidoreductase [Ktedonobacteraceae bacterium]|nr:NAD(P)-dependent oxidoreductase [Ktedonobacteraceae bacterium]